MNVLKIVACLLFFSFVWCVGYGDTPLKQKKEESNIIISYFTVETTKVTE